MFKQVDCFRNHLKFCKLLGIYPMDISRPLLYAFYSKIFVFFFIIMYNILFTANFFFIPKDLDIYIEHLIFYFSLLSIVSKVLTFLFKRYKIKEVINMLESDIFQPENKEETRIIDEAKSTNRRYWKIYTAVCTTSNLFHIMSPLLSHIIFKAALFLPVCSYSFLPDDVIYYFIYPLYFYQSVGMHIHVLFAINIDTFIVGLMVFLIAQLEILGNKLTNSTDKFKCNAKIPQNDMDLLLKLNKVIIHYGEVIKFCSLIEDIFSIAIFIHFSMGSYIICMCLIKFTMPATSQYLIFLSTYTSAMIIQIFIPCWLGTLIMDKSCQLSHAIYSCDWTPRSKRFKSSMRLFVERANRPLSITGWKMFPLSLTTFTSIMNTGYSVFSVLRNMQSR